jgi:hypothetical protein
MSRHGSTSLPHLPAGTLATMGPAAAALASNSSLYSDEWPYRNDCARKPSIAAWASKYRAGLRLGPRSGISANLRQHYTLKIHLGDPAAMLARIVLPSTDRRVILKTKSHPRVSALKLEERQQTKRLRKMKRGFRGPQHNWLLWWVQHCESQAAFSNWFLDNMSSIVHVLPESIYRFAIEALVSSKELSFEQEYGMFVWRIDEIHQIVALPNVGLIAFLAPSGGFRKAIDPPKKVTSWNFSIEGAVFSDGTSSTINSIQRAEYVHDLQKKFGLGQGAAIAIIDSGILKDSPEFAGRVLGTWAIKLDKHGAPRPDFGGNEDDIGHGTATAAIAAGKTYGIAPQSKILSIKMPMKRVGDKALFRLIDLSCALNVLESDSTPAIEGLPCLDFIDTILLPNGFYLKDKKCHIHALKNIVDAISRFGRFHEVVVVAAIGNTPGAVAFPSDDPHVISVGALEAETLQRARHSGWGKDITGKDVPVVHFPGSEVPCLGLSGGANRLSGTSAAAAGVAGVVSIFVKGGKSSRSRWQRMRNNIIQRTDSYGSLPTFSLTVQRQGGNS